MRIDEVTLQAPAGRIEELTRFYTRLGLAALSTYGSSGSSDGDPLTPVSEWRATSIQIGWSQLSFSEAPEGEQPYYHFALLVPGDRMEEALEWAILDARLQLLPFSEDPADLVIHFEDWNAHSVYFHDPAQNIVELIAHTGVGENGRTDAFSAAELLGISEIGLIGNPVGVAAALSDRLRLSVFQGSTETLAFIGEPTAALILAEEGWPWMNQGRPAQSWPAMVSLGDVPSGGWAAAGIHQVEITPGEDGD